jgi:hypothetical protein
LKNDVACTILYLPDGGVAGNMAFGITAMLKLDMAWWSYTER